MGLYGLHHRLVLAVGMGGTQISRYRQISGHFLRLHQRHEPELVLAQVVRSLLLLLPNRQLEEEEGRGCVLCLLHFQRCVVIQTGY